jgi:type IV secretion system protein VirD4
MLKVAAILFVACLAIVLGYPCAAAVAHGLNPAAWPAAVLSPDQWLHGLLSSYALPNAGALLEMATGHSPAFSGGGLLQIFFISAVPIAFMLVLPSAKRGPCRDPDALQGDARWATNRERSTMKKGLEFGRDSETGKPIRVAVEGNILTIAPPRRRKTSGLIIPNLVAADKAAWSGPAVVVDPKGHAYRAVVDRRQALGKTVRCLDPMAICGGSDRWNPLSSMNPSDTAYLQRVARTLLPSAVSEENAYFQNKAVDVIVAAFQAAQHMRNATPLAVSELLASSDQLADALKGVAGTTANRVRQFLTMDAKTRDPILSTAQQAFQWCDDERLQTLTSESTFSLVDLCAGDTDLFITLPTENLEALAPFLRWLLADLFATIRRNRVAERLIIFVDETKTLGNCRELITAAGELPGAGASLWTFWQDRSQMMACYGLENGATLLRTSEFVTVSDPAMIDPDEREFWSRALGDFTVLEETKVADKSAQGARTSTSQAPRGVRLMTAEELGRLPSTDLILFPNSDRYAKRAVRLKKTRHDDQRFTGLTTPVAPVGPTT